MFFDKLFGTGKPASPQTDNVKLLCTIYSPSELAVIESLLRSEKIPYLVRDRGAGEATRIITGANVMFGSDIYVDNENFEFASALITPNENADDEEQ